MRLCNLLPSMRLTICMRNQEHASNEQMEQFSPLLISIKDILMQLLLFSHGKPVAGRQCHCVRGYR